MNFAARQDSSRGLPRSEQRQKSKAPRTTPRTGPGCLWFAKSMPGSKPIRRVCVERKTINRCPGPATVANKIMKIRFPFLSATLALLALVICMLAFGIICASQAVGLVLMFQLALTCLSAPQRALFLGGLTHEQIKEFERILDGMEKHEELFKSLPSRLQKLEEENDTLRRDLKKINKSRLEGLGGLGSSGVRWIGEKAFVSEDCAKALTSVFTLQCAQLSGALDHMVPDASARQRVIALAAATLGMETRAAMTSTEIPLPTIYTPQIVELVFKYGQARQYATVFPLGAGTVKLPRLKAGEDDFGYLGAGTAGMSQNVAEKKVAAELVTFTANKAGGLIRLPFELEEDTFVQIGQFLARYIARQLAKLEDKTMFLADGTGTYASQTGVGPYCVANPTYLLQLAAGKTKPSDATLDDLRNLRSKVSGALLSGGFDAAYYMSPTWEPALRSFNKYPNFVVYENVNGKPMFDGWPVRWVGVTQPYLTAAAPGTFPVFFGDLSYWYLGERGVPRVEVSREIFFATDEIAMRALERIDVEAMAIDAMAALQTAAA
jgi:HK97 family phage major capsid protein